MRSLTRLTRTDIVLYLREPIATFFTVAFPALLVLLFGSIFGNQPSEMFGGYGSMDVSMPGYTAMILVTVALMSLPITTAGYRESGVLRRFKVTPLRPLTYILADLSANLIWAVLGMLVVLLLGWLIYHVRFAGHWWSFLLGVIYGFVAMASIGYLIASLAPSARAAQISGMVLLYPMIFLAGAAMPLEVLPKSLQQAAAFLPLTYVVRLLRGLWFGDPLSEYWPSILILGMITLICGLLAARLFKWD